VVSVGRVRLLRNGQISLLTKLGMRFQHAGVAISHHRVAESRNVDCVPSSSKNQITHQNFIFKRSSKVAWLPFFYLTFNLTPNSRNSLQLGSLELCHFNVGVKHSLNESSVFVNLVGFTN